MDEMTPSKQTLASSSMILVLWSQWNHHGEANTKLDIAPYRMSVSSDCWCPLGLCKDYETYHHCETQTHSIPQPSRATKKNIKYVIVQICLRLTRARWHFLGLNFHEFSELGMSVGSSHGDTIPIFKTGCESVRVQSWMQQSHLSLLFDSPT